MTGVWTSRKTQKKNRTVFVLATSDECLTQYKLEDKKCQARYTYKTENGIMLVAVFENQCWKTMSAGATAGIIVGAILAAGALAILVYKIRITMKDREEYKKFVTEKDNFSKVQNENPLYNSPIREYKMPTELEMSPIYSKED